MPRRIRLEFPGATHWVRLIAVAPSDRTSKMVSAPNGRRIEDALSEVCMACGADLYAYYIDENRLVFLAERQGGSMASLMQRLSSRYWHLLRVSARDAGVKIVNRRYDSKVVAPDYLPYVVRRIHNMPIIAGLCAQRIDYPFSSERAYLGETHRAVLDTARVLSALEQRGYSGLRGYRQFMAKNDTPRVAALLSYGASEDPRIVGDLAFVRTVHRTASRRGHPTPNLDTLILSVSELMGQRPNIVYSRTRTGTLARALVAWYGVKLGVASLTGTARRFSVSTAALGQAVRRYRGSSPKLFEALPRIDPPG